MISILKNFYANKKVLITGHTGFKGAWLTLMMSSLGAKVYGYALAPKGRNNLYSLLDLDKHTHSTYQDISNLNYLEKFICETEPEIIFHMAAQSLVIDSYDNPYETFMVNVLGTLNLLEVVRKANLFTSIVNVTSDKCYENFEHKKFSEHDKLGGEDPYSASKACSEIITHCYRMSFGEDSNFRVASARAGNVIGGGDFSQNRIIPDIIRAIEDDQPLRLRYPKAQRPWQHVFDVLYGYLILGYKLFSSKQYAYAYNFALDEEKLFSVEELVNLFKRNIGLEFSIIKSDPKHSEKTSLILNSYKAREDLGWNPVLSIDLAVTKTAQWYKNFLENKSNIKNFSYDSFYEYCNLVER